MNQSYGTSPAMWDHSVTYHLTKLNMPHFTQTKQAGTRFISPRGKEAWVDLHGCLYTKRVYLFTNWSK